MTPARVCDLCQCWHSPGCSATPPGTRWPLAPLVARAGSSTVRSVFDSGALTRAARDGLSDVQSDRWAIRCGVHPAAVWPDWTAPALRPIDPAKIAALADSRTLRLDDTSEPNR